MAGPLDEETRRAIEKSIASDKTAEMLDSETAPAGDGPGDIIDGETAPSGGIPRPFTDEGPMVSRDEAAASLAASGPRRPLELGREAPTLPGLVEPEPRMAEQNRPSSSGGEQKEQPRGFDWARALYVGGGGNATDIDKIREARDPTKKRMAEQQLAMQQGELADKQAERATKLKDIREAMDPNSEASRSAQESAAALHNARAQILSSRNPALAKMFADAAVGAKGKTRLQLANSEKNYSQIMGEFGKMLDSEARQKLAAEGMDLKRQGVAAQQDNAAATRALSGQQLNETIRHNKATEDNAGNKLDAKVQGNQDKLNEKIESLNNMEENLQIAKDAKKNVDVGPFATTWNKLRQYTPWPNKDFNTLQEYLGNVRNEIKLLKSGKAVTPTEEKGLNEEMANLEKYQDDPTFEQRLQGMSDRIASIKKRSVNLYQRKHGGETVDRSNTARGTTKQDLSLTPGEQSGSSQSDKARAWLQANPNDPRAAAVRAKLQAMGAQ